MFHVLWWELLTVTTLQQAVGLQVLEDTKYLSGARRRRPFQQGDLNIVSTLISKLLHCVALRYLPTWAGSGPRHNKSVL